MIAILALTLMGILFGLGLGYAGVRFKVDGDPIVEQIDAVLPQTQCGQCGYPGCRPYAEAIAKSEADINQCPPGGEAGVVALADLLDRDPKPLAAEPGTVAEIDMVAVINEETCIGCTKCIQACPVDAILGAAKQTHIVLEEYCTGCKLCLEPVCPVQGCIEMVPAVQGIDAWHWPEPATEQQPVMGVIDGA
ncbi:MAG: electron transport complex subunit RsxB [Granulosicoccaceae bacterium]|jgi:electron transport complex protein RnfB